MTQKKTPRRHILMELMETVVIDGILAAQRLFRRVRKQPPPLPEFELAAPGDLQPRAFQETAAKDGGIFGRWIIDEAGLPAFSYELDQYKDPRAGYPNTEGIDRRDHWHQVGNTRVTALASNDGTVQLYLADRGGVFLNRFEAHDSDKTLPGTWAMRLLRRALGFVIGLYRRLLLRRMLTAWPQSAAPRYAVIAEAQPHPPDRAQLHEETRYAFAGGFAYLEDGEEVWASAYRYRPAGAETRRVFGTGYSETEMTYRGVRLTRRVYAPHGDDPVLLIDVQIENLCTQPADLWYYEYWDVNIHQLRLQWVRTGLAGFVGDEERRGINNRFAPSITWDPQAQALRFHQEPPPDAPPPDQINVIDWVPADVFLADLTGAANEKYTDKAKFFGAGGPTHPDAVRARRAGEVGASSDVPMPFCMALRRDLHLTPRETVALRYAYGAVRPCQPLDWLDAYRTGDPFARMSDCWKEQLAYFTTGRDLALQREMAWHAYNLLASTVYNVYYDAHVTPQGAAYLYLHGADGVPRDQALFSLPLAYLNPALTRDNLRLVMSMADAKSGQISYAYAGYGVQEGAMIHEAPSDLDLFLLLALGEYLAATGDMTFLDLDVPFYPRDAQPPAPFSKKVIDHVRVAVKHLMESINTGDNGLIRISDGDWSDAIVVTTAMDRGGVLGFLGWFENSKEHGESVPNTQMALYVLPLIANLIEPRDPALAKRIRDWLPGLRDAVDAQWTGRWYTRAILRDESDQPVTLGREEIYLESQPWALISGRAAETQREKPLIEAIKAYLDDPSPIGAMLSPKDRAVWPAVSQLLTWGYTRSRPDLAWRSLKNHTFAANARAFPNTWINKWSGPDGVNAKDAPNPGGAWASPVTPMTDFPAMNMNQHAMALLGLLRVCGVEPAPKGDGLVIAPHVPGGRFVLDLPLLCLEVGPGRIAGEYRAAVEGIRTLYVRTPDGADDIQARVGGRQVEDLIRSEREVALTLRFSARQVVPFEVTWKAPE